jgi:predicted  nucleic acid-binding Zn-ribbon protein
MATLKLKIPGIKVEYEGAEKLPENRALQLLEAMKKSNNEDVKKKLSELNEGLEQNLAALDGHVASLSKLSKELARRIKEVNEKSMKFFEKVETLATSNEGTADLLAATQKMQETQMSFNLQYLQLQSQMQHENRSYTAVSNIMKTKHDTVKNSISNIR